MTKGYQGGKLVSAPASKTSTGHSSKAFSRKHPLQIIGLGRSFERLPQLYRQDGT